MCGTGSHRGIVAVACANLYRSGSSAEVGDAFVVATSSRRVVLTPLEGTQVGPRDRAQGTGLHRGHTGAQAGPRALSL